MPGPDTGEEFTDPVAHLVRTLPTVYRYGPAPADLAARVPSLVRLLGGVTPAPGGPPRTERQAFYERATSASTLLTTVVEAVGGVDGAALRIMTRTAEDPTRRRPRTLDQRREAAGALRRVRGETFQRNYEPRLTLASRWPCTPPPSAGNSPCRRDPVTSPTSRRRPPAPTSPATAGPDRAAAARAPGPHHAVQSNPTAAGPRCHRRTRPPPHGRAAEAPAPCPPGRRARRRRRHRPGSAPRPAGRGAASPPPAGRDRATGPPASRQTVTWSANRGKQGSTRGNTGRCRRVVTGNHPPAGGDPTRGADDGGPGGRRRPLSQPP